MIVPLIFVKNMKSVMLKLAVMWKKLDTDAPLPPSATGNYKFRVKVKSLPPQQINSQYTIKRTSLTTSNLR